MSVFVDENYYYIKLKIKYYYNYLYEAKKKENLTTECQMLLHNSKSSLRIYKLKKKMALQNRHKF
jgi:hypothetical protein